MKSTISNKTHIVGLNLMKVDLKVLEKIGKPTYDLNVKKKGLRSLVLSSDKIEPRSITLTTLVTTATTMTTTTTIAN